MSPIEQLARLYYDIHPDGNFATESGWYIENGIFHCDQSVACMLRFSDTRTPLSYDGDMEHWKDGEPNAWYCAYAAGDMDGLRRVAESLEPRMEYIIFDNKKHIGRYTIIQTDRFIKGIINE